MKHFAKHFNKGTSLLPRENHAFQLNAGGGVSRVSQQSPTACLIDSKSIPESGKKTTSCSGEQTNSNATCEKRNLWPRKLRFHRYGLFRKSIAEGRANGNLHWRVSTETLKIPLPGECLVHRRQGMISIHYVLMPTFDLVERVGYRKTILKM